MGGSSKRADLRHVMSPVSIVFMTRVRMPTPDDGARSGSARVRGGAVDGKRNNRNKFVRFCENFRGRPGRRGIRLHRADGDDTPATVAWAIR
ncbi:hypothetical protein GSH05_16610 [Burkholderia pseudomallei]|nr:hypothetical protein BOC35_00070 [Burkholderia pseudomallei]EDO90236.1 hypothetical protein BURPSPAST_T0471 [Burkholderia pseudomallei Pasteur 52237]EDS83048.1 hypothetical protein BURPSS13_X0274 [Burkholderia pseudomallei S13]PNX03804.1 hypothetical protein CF649_11560 [Burkholderia sp. 136(2017)]PNX15828.1 hypothetical protein CF650_10355 [Burkholderia sp. 129]PNX30309.1 hypothetical protein CF647_11605 [Burkholderia sp. 117]PNX39333.1 hypothetical protein CF648_11560 [Burkholderia sp. 1